MTNYYSWHAKQLNNYKYFVVCIKGNSVDYKGVPEIVQETIQYIFGIFLNLKEIFYRGKGGNKKSVVKLHGFMEYDEQFFSLIYFCSCIYTWIF
jgi:hypothetical protein